MSNTVFLRVLGAQPSHWSGVGSVRLFRSRPSRPTKATRTRPEARRSPEKPLGRVERREFGPGKSRAFRARTNDRDSSIKERKDDKNPPAQRKSESAAKLNAPKPSTKAPAPSPRSSANLSEQKPLPTVSISKSSLLLFGRKTVLDAILEPSIKIERLFVLDKLREESAVVIDPTETEQSSTPMKALFAAVAKMNHKDIKIEFLQRKELTAISKHQQQDQGVVAIIQNPAGRLISLSEFLNNKPSRYSLLALEGISSETNMGTIVRTAAAAPNIDAVLLLENCCSIQNPMVQFASCGVSIKANFIYAPITKKMEFSLESSGKDSSAALTQLKNDGASVCVLAPAAKEDFYTFQPGDKVVYVLGSESTGVSTEVKQVATNSLRIPLARNVESLSVASAAAIVAFCRPPKK
eukprot:TRINITY_DN8943_c0_g1_i1.p1 TRINITY_DN8943_c0_g1~~TRINITY_DN8943_c0_g1_i1.p1  ORF type:complete len:409 (+),score=51.32 TRINITY_DN8943_c0_g1_i1:140-1366(+)